jgi:NOL1/NOP2/fmu family ribosome biogenesis protein
VKAEIIILNSKDRKIIRQTLNEQFGISDIPDNIVYFCLNNKERVYICNRELFDIEQDIFRTNTFGLYFGTFMVDGFRLSLEGSQLIGPLANKNMFIIDDQQFEEYIKGENLVCENEEFQKQYVIVKHNNDFLGVGRVKENTLTNHLPKSRRLKNVFNPDSTE